MNGALDPTSQLNAVAHAKRCSQLPSVPSSKICRRNISKSCFTPSSDRQPQKGETKARTNTQGSFSVPGDGCKEMAEGWVSCIIDIYIYTDNIYIA